MTKKEAMEKAEREGYRYGVWAVDTGNVTPNYYHKGGRCWHAFERGYREGCIDAKCRQLCEQRSRKGVYNVNHVTA